MSVPVSGRPDPRRLEPLWDRVDRNRWLLLGYLALFAAVGAAWFAVVYLAVALLLAAVAEPSGLALLRVPLGVVEGGTWQETALRAWGIGVVATILYEWRALSRSERTLLRRLDATIVARGELIDTKMALKDMAIAAGFEVAPSLHLIDASSVNAFVAATPGRRPVVGVTQGLISKLTIAEQRAVFANLVARLVSGDTAVATAVTALMWPLQSWRASREQSQNEAIDEEMSGRRTDAEADPLASLLFFGFALVVLGEIAAALHRRAQLRSGEKADAEGMLLLKEPATMLAALEKCVRFDNVVPTAAEAYGKLFYCWTGDSTNDDEDPEWHRVARLREVLGVEGAPPDVAAGTASHTTTGHPVGGL
jgi:Zn-dependent protease with chaperone function